MKSKLSNNKVYAILACLLVITEVVIATKLNNFHYIRHYFGDFLVVILLYFMVRSVVRISPKPLAIGILVFAILVEVAQYFHLADALGLAQGGVARIVLGASFSITDLLMYTAGSWFVYWLDVFIIERRSKVGVKH